MTIKTENWLGEYTSTIGTGDITLGGAIDGFAGFSNVGENVDVYYTVMDALDKETGIGTLTGGKLVRKDIHATLVDGAYVKNGSAINLSGDAQVYGTVNAHFLDYVQAVANAEIVNTQAIAELKALQINGHALTASFNLTAADVGAHPDSWMPSTEALNVYQKAASDIRYIKTQDAEQVAGLVMRVGGEREQQLQQSINDLSTAFIGIDEALRRSYAEAGYNLVAGSFEAGGTLANANDVLLQERTGKAFSGPAGAVVAGTNPASGWFTDRSEVLLRSKVGSIVANSTHVADVPGIDLSGSVNNRSAIFAVSGSVFIPVGMSVWCNLLPDDDVRKFVGKGKVLSTDPWGFTHTLDVAAMYIQQDRSDQGRIFQAFHTHEWCRVGVLGDSITDGADATGWTANPTDVNGNLNSSNYDHSLLGGSGSWFRTFADNLNFLANPAYVYSSAYIKPHNAASSGKRLADGWGYRNFDYGFFQNAAYGNKAPDVLYIALGYNDASYTDTPSEMESYRDQLDKLICKARGYGCSVALVTINTNDVPRKSQERSVKESAAKKYGINYYDLSVYLDKYRRSGFEPASSMWQDPNLSWDTTHPKTQTQQFLGAAMTHAVASNMLICAGEDINHIPLTGADFRNLTYPGGVQKSVSQFKLSGGYLDQIDGWALIWPGENITITYPVWCDDTQLSAIIFEPFHPDYTTSDRSHSLGTRLNDRRSTKQINTLASAKFPDHTKWLTTRIGKLKYGLNWIEVIYDGAPLRVYPPAILFRKSNNSFTIGKVTRFAAPGIEFPICLFGARERLLNTKYQATSGLDLMVDENNTDNYDSLGWFTIGGGDGVAMLVSYKTGEGIQITKVDNTTVTIGLAGQAVDATLTGVFSNGFSVAINHEPNGSSTAMRVSIYDDNSAAVSSRLMSPPNGVGGALSVINTSSSTKPISVSGGYGYLT